MNALTHETPQQAAPGLPRRTWIVVLVAVLAVAGFAVGIWATIDANQSGDLAVASERGTGRAIPWPSHRRLLGGHGRPGT